MCVNEILDVRVCRDLPMTIRRRKGKSGVQMCILRKCMNLLCMVHTEKQQGGDRRMCRERKGKTKTPRNTIARA